MDGWMDGWVIISFSGFSEETKWFSVCLFCPFHLWIWETHPNLLRLLLHSYSQEILQRRGEPLNEYIHIYFSVCVCVSLSGPAVNQWMSVSFSLYLLCSSVYMFWYIAPSCSIIHYSVWQFNRLNTCFQVVKDLHWWYSSKGIWSSSTSQAFGDPSKKSVI